MPRVCGYENGKDNTAYLQEVNGALGPGRPMPQPKTTIPAHCVLTIRAGEAQDSLRVALHENLAMESGGGLGYLQGEREEYERECRITATVPIAFNPAVVALNVQHPLSPALYKRKSLSDYLNNVSLSQLSACEPSSLLSLVCWFISSSIKLKISSHQQESRVTR